MCDILFSLGAMHNRVNRGDVETFGKKDFIQFIVNIGFDTADKEPSYVSDLITFNQVCLSSQISQYRYPSIIQSQGTAGPRRASRSWTAPPSSAHTAKLGRPKMKIYLCQCMNTSRLKENNNSACRPGIST